MTDVKLIYGTIFLSRPEEQVWFPQAMNLLEKHGVASIDTAQAYPGSEAALAKLGATSRFSIDTKWRGGFKGPDEPKEPIVSAMDGSLAALELPSVDIYYVHCPPSDRTLDELAEEIQDLFKAGKFKRFGLSNFSAEDVQRLHGICNGKGYVLPSVYQGNYSAIARKPESGLLITLRKLRISFYAYSPLASGFLVKSKEQVLAGEGRFDTSNQVGQIFFSLFAKSETLDILDEWADIAKDAGISRAELGYRWVKYNSALKAEHGDGIVIGASRLEQLEQTLNSFEVGPLEERTVKRIDHIWSKLAPHVVQDLWNP